MSGQMEDPLAAEASALVASLRTLSWFYSTFLFTLFIFWVQPPPSATMFMCDVCGHAFKQHGNLLAHANKHTAAKTFTCDDEGCGQEFRWQGSLIRHRKVVHAGLRPFVCTECDQSFTRGAHLVQHTRSHTGEVSVSGVCGSCSSLACLARLRFAAAPVLVRRLWPSLLSAEQPCHARAYSFCNA